MPIISVIVAVDQLNAIGYDQKLLCYLPDDLKHFKSVTMGKPVIMGRKTFQSLPNGPLPNRRNIVITSDPEQFQGVNVEAVTSLDQALALCKSEEEVFIIGGASLYAAVVDRADRLYVTHIDYTFPQADTYFPVIGDNYELIEKQKHPVDEKHRYSFSFVTYSNCQRKK